MDNHYCTTRTMPSETTEPQGQPPDVQTSKELDNSKNVVEVSISATTMPI